MTKAKRRKIGSKAKIVLVTGIAHLGTIVRGPYTVKGCAWFHADDLTVLDGAKILLPLDRIFDAEDARVPDHAKLRSYMDRA